MPKSLQRSAISSPASHKLQTFIHHRTLLPWHPLFPPQKGEKCNLCLRYDLSPMCRVAHSDCKALTESICPPIPRFRCTLCTNALIAVSLCTLEPTSDRQALSLLFRSRTSKCERRYKRRALGPAFRPPPAIVLPKLHVVFPAFGSFFLPFAILNALMVR